MIQLTTARAAALPRPRVLLCAALLLGAPVLLPAQSTTTVDAATLAKYDKNGNGRLDADEAAALRADEAKNTPRLTTRKAEDGSDVVQMTPFEVNAGGDKGYYASSTMSGTRLNSKIEDLGASITVVTKQQLLDTAARDINDVFLYEANTEGTGQFTSFTIDRGNVVDNVAQTPQTANRIRGLSSANIAMNGFASDSNIPISTYNIDAVEISRGPNSTIFGLGDASGTVNLIAARANTTRDSSKISGSVDSYSGWNTNWDFNRKLINGKLAFRVLGTHEEKGFVRKPSADITNRYTGAVTYQPFRYTTLRGSFEYYANFNQRPNSVPPRDAVSYWRAQGSPTWDPVTWTAYYPGGTKVVPVGSGATGENNWNVLPLGLISAGTSLFRPAMLIDNGKLALFTYNHAGASTASNEPFNARYIFSGTDLQRGFFGANGVGSPLYAMPVVTDKSIYDWTKTNYAAPNYGLQHARIYNIEFEQMFLNTPRNILGLQAGWHREDSKTYSRNIIGASDGIPSILQIDVNRRLLDGSPNPFYLHPFMGGNEPSVQFKPTLNDNYRGTLAYQLDLSRDARWTHWIGRHRLAAYGEYRNIVTAPRNIRYRDQIVNSNSITLTPTNIVGSNGAHLYPRYYMGDADGTQVVDYAPARMLPSHGTFSLQYYDAAAKQWKTETDDIEETYYANGLQKQKIRTEGASLQSFLLKDKVVTTFGVRKDRNYYIDSLGAYLDNESGFLVQSPIYTFGQNKKWTKGTTKQAGVVVKPFKWLDLHYNTSDSFLPADINYNIFGQVLPNPTGKGKDYGFTLKLLNDTLFLKVNRYDTFQKNARGTIGVIATRAIRMDFIASGGGGGDPRLYDRYQTALVAYNLSQGIVMSQAELDAATQKGTGITRDVLNAVAGKTINDTNDAQSKGTEVELNYNPNKFWTVKLAGAQQQAIDSNLSPTIAEYVANRIDTWKTVVLPGQTTPWWNNTYSGSIVNAFFTVNVLAPLKLAIANEGKPRPQTREYSANLSTRYLLAGVTNNKWLRNVTVGGAVRWASRAAIGYYGGTPDSDGAVREYNANRPIYDKPMTNVDLFTAYNFKMWRDRINTRVQLNVRNVTESGQLRPIAANPDGVVWNYRIIDPRQFILTVSFDL
jgi:outer membrane receptor protein involved in Fe transport